VLRASISHAALNHRPEVTQDDIQSVLPLALHHRAKRSHGNPSTPPPDEKQSPGGESSESAQGSTNATDRVFSSELREAPELRLGPVDSIYRGRRANGKTASGAGRFAPASNGGTLDVVASFTQSFRNTGTASLKGDHLVFRTPQAPSGVRFIFVVDTSGSHAAQQRMRAVKGAAAALLESSVDRSDEVAVISFRGAKAAIVLEPCRDADAALRVLEFLPTGGRTPLAHALELGRSLVNPACVLILLTDGRANVPVAGGDPWADALDAASKLNCSSVLVDSSLDRSTADATATLALAMRARLIHLDELSRETLLSVLRQ
jgi:magnesium chelatase subunit D